MLFNEINGDLFKSEPTSSLAHCIAKDLKMGKGVSGLFKKKFGPIDCFKNQNLQVGSVGILKDNERYVYYLITKSKTSGYPTLNDLKESLISMKTHAIENNVKTISMPRIGSGLDKLDWDLVKNTIIEVFNDIDININVYFL